MIAQKGTVSVPTPFFPFQVSVQSLASIQGGSLLVDGDVRVQNGLVLTTSTARVTGTVVVDGTCLLSSGTLAGSGTVTCADVNWKTVVVRDGLDLLITTSGLFGRSDEELELERQSFIDRGDTPPTSRIDDVHAVVAARVVVQESAVVHWRHGDIGLCEGAVFEVRGTLNVFDADRSGSMSIVVCDPNAGTAPSFVLARSGKLDVLKPLSEPIVVLVSADVAGDVLLRAGTLRWQAGGSFTGSLAAYELAVVELDGGFFYFSPASSTTVSGDFKVTSGEADIRGSIDLEGGNFRFEGGSVTVREGAKVVSNGSPIRVDGGSVVFESASFVVPYVRLSNGGLLQTDGTISIAGALDIDGGSLLVDGLIDVGGDLNLNGGTVGGTGSLRVSGDMVWGGGSLVGAGSTDVGGSITLTGSGDKTLSKRQLNVDGTATMEGSGDLIGEDGALIWVGANGVFHLDGTGRMMTNAQYSKRPIFRVNGVLEVRAGLHEVQWRWEHLAGSTNLQFGSLLLTGGGVEAASTKVYAGRSWTLGNGTFEVLKPARFFDAGDVVVTGADTVVQKWTGNSGLSAGGTLDVTGGAIVHFYEGATWTGLGLFRTRGGAQSWMHEPTSDLSFRFQVPVSGVAADGLLRVLPGATVRIEKTSTVSGVGAHLLLEPRASLEVQRNSAIYADDGEMSLTVALSGMVTVNGEMRVVAGTVDAVAGTVRSDGAGTGVRRATVGAGAVLTVRDGLLWENVRMDVAGELVWSKGNVVVKGGESVWTVGGTGKFTMGPLRLGAAATMSNPVDDEFAAASLVNDGGVVRLVASGTRFDLGLPYSGTGRMEVESTLRLLAGAAMQSGSVVDVSGTLQMWNAGAAYELEAGSAVTGAGAITTRGGALLVVNGDFTGASSDALVSAGTGGTVRLGVAADLSAGSCLAVESSTGRVEIPHDSGTSHTVRCVSVAYGHMVSELPLTVTELALVTSGTLNMTAVLGVQKGDASAVLSVRAGRLLSTHAVNVEQLETYGGVLDVPSDVTVSSTYTFAGGEWTQPGSTYLNGAVEVRADVLRTSAPEVSGGRHFVVSADSALSSTLTVDADMVWEQLAGTSVTATSGSLTAAEGAVMVLGENVRFLKSGESTYTCDLALNTSAGVVVEAEGTGLVLRGGSDFRAGTEVLVRSGKVLRLNHGVFYFRRDSLLLVQGTGELKIDGTAVTVSVRRRLLEEGTSHVIFEAGMWLNGSITVGSSVDIMPGAIVQEGVTVLLTDGGYLRVGSPSGEPVYVPRIEQTGGTVVLYAGVTLGDVLVSGGEVLAPDSEFAVDEPLQVHRFVQTGGVVSGAAQLTVLERFSWFGGSWASNGSIVIQGLGLLVGRDGQLDPHAWVGRTVDVVGPTEWVDGLVEVSMPGAWTQRGDAAFVVADVVNASSVGFFYKLSAGSVPTVTERPTMEVHGALARTDGTARSVKLGVEVTLLATATASSAAAGGSLHFSGGVVVQAGAQLQALGGDMVFSSASMRNTQVTLVAGAVLAGSGVMRVTAETDAPCDAGCGVSVLLEAAPGAGSWAVDGGVLRVADGLSFTGAGSLVAVQGGVFETEGVSSSGVNVDRLVVGGGTVRTGTPELGVSVFFLQEGGVVQAAGGAVTLGGAATQTGGTLDSVTTVTSTGGYAWSGGSWTGTGSLSLLGGLTIAPAAGTAVNVGGALVVSVDSDAVWSLGGVAMTGTADFRVLPSRTLTVAGTGPEAWTATSGTPTLTVLGDLVKEGGEDESVIATPTVVPTSTAALLVKAGGVLRFSNASLAVSGSASVTAHGLLRLSGDVSLDSTAAVLGSGGYEVVGADSVVLVSNDVTLSGGNWTLLAGETRVPRGVTWTSSSNLVVAGGNLTWTSGVSGVTTVAGTVTHSAGGVKAESGAVVHGTGTYRLSGAGELDVHGTVSWCNFEQSGGTVTGPGTFNIECSIVLSAGSWRGTGASYILNGATFTISGDFSVQYRTIYIQGDLTWTGGDITLDGVEWVVSQGGTMTVVGGDSLSGADSTLRVAGALSKTAGGDTSVSVPLDVTSTGVVGTSSGAGDLHLLGGGVVEGTMVASDGSEVFFDQGVFNVTISARLTGDSSYRVRVVDSGWTEVHLYGAVQNAGSFSVEGGQVNVGSTAVFTSNVIVRVIDGRLVVPSAGPVFPDQPSATIGNLQQTGGTIVINSDFNMTDAYNMTGGAIEVNGEANFGNFSMNGGSLSGGGDIYINGVFVWYNGALGGDGSLNINGGGNVRGDLSVTGGRAVNVGGEPFNWDYGNIDLSTDSVWTILQGGTMFIRHPGAYTLGGSGGAALNVNGQMTQTGGGTTTYTVVVNLGEEGLFMLQNGAWVMMGGAQFGNGTVAVDAPGVLTLGDGSFELGANGRVTDSVQAQGGAVPTEYVGGQIGITGGTTVVYLNGKVDPYGGVVTVNNDANLLLGGGGGGSGSAEFGVDVLLGLLGGVTRTSNGGVVDARVHRMIMVGDAELIVADGNLNVSGEFNMSGGSADVQHVLNVQTVYQTGGTVGGSGTVNGLGTWTADGGAWTGDGTTNVQGGLDLLDSIVSSLVVTDRSVNVTGTARLLQGGQLTLINSEWVVHYGAELLVLGGGNGVEGDADSSVTLRGNMTRAGGADGAGDSAVTEWSVNMVVDVEGSVSLEEGTFQFNREADVYGYLGTSWPGRMVITEGGRVVSLGDFLLNGPVSVSVDLSSLSILGNASSSRNGTLSVGEGGSVFFGPGTQFGSGDQSSNSLIVHLVGGNAYVGDCATCGVDGAAVSGDGPVLLPNLVIETGTVRVEGNMTVYLTLNATGAGAQLLGEAGSETTLNDGVVDGGTIGGVGGGEPPARFQLDGRLRLGRATFSDGQFIIESGIVIDGPLNLDNAVVVQRGDSVWQNGDVRTSGATTWTISLNSTLFVNGTGSYSSDSADRQSSITVGPGGTLAKTGGNDTLIEVWIVVPQGGTVSASGGELVLTAGAEINGSLVTHQPSGMKFTAVIYVLGATSNVTGDGAITVDGADVRLSGDVNMLGELAEDEGGNMVRGASGSWSITRDGSLSLNGGRLLAPTTVLNGTITFHVLVDGAGQVNYTWVGGAVYGPTSSVQIPVGVDVVLTGPLDAWDGVVQLDGQLDVQPESAEFPEGGELNVRGTTVIQGCGVLNVYGEMTWYWGAVYNGEQCGNITVPSGGRHEIQSPNSTTVFGGWTYQNDGRFLWESGFVICYENSPCFFENILDDGNYTTNNFTGVLNASVEAHKRLFGNFLECDPEFYGARCQCYIPFEPADSQYPLVLDVGASAFEGDVLTIYLEDSLKYQQTTFTVNGCSANWTWVEEELEDTCVWRWRGHATWANIYKYCDYVREELNATAEPQAVDTLAAAGSQEEPLLVDSIVFTMDIWVSHVEELGDFRGTPLQRRRRQRLSPQIIFPKVVTVQASVVDVFAPTLVFMAVTEQLSVQVDPASGELRPRAELQLFTQVQWPFQLKTPRHDMLPYGVEQGGAGPVEELHNSVEFPCDTAEGAVCEQAWRVPLDLVDTCRLDGSYVVKMDFLCRSERAADCPIDVATGTATFYFTLRSPDLCPSVAHSVHLASELDLYQNAGHTVVKDDFVDPQTLYFQMPTLSDEASLAGTEVIDVRILRPGGDVLLLRDRVNGVTPLGTSVGFAASPGARTLPGLRSLPAFQYQLVAAELGLAEDAIETVIVQATVAVTYENAGQAVRAGEGAPQLQGEAVGVQAPEEVREVQQRSMRVVLRAPLREAPPSPSAEAGSDVAVVGGAVAGMLLVALLAALAVRRRRRKREVGRMLAATKTEADRVGEGVAEPGAHSGPAPLLAAPSRLALGEPSAAGVDGEEAVVFDAQEAKWGTDAGDVVARVAESTGGALQSARDAYSAGSEDGEGEASSVSLSPLPAFPSSLELGGSGSSATLRDVAEYYAVMEGTKLAGAAADEEEGR